MRPDDKLKRLIRQLKTMESLAVAYSGGVDSSFLLKIAHDVLGNRAVAVTARSPIHAEREFQEAIEFVRQEGIDHVVISSEELDLEGFAANPPNRCYLCKRALFSKMGHAARQKGLGHVVEGSNTDDIGDYRPGMQAIEELKIMSPLKEAGLNKEEIRRLSKIMGLQTWNKPAFACLASRFPYGMEITREKLHMVEQAEQILLDLGFRQTRVRHHGDVARIEIPPGERRRFFNDILMDEVQEKFKALGFAYTALDLRGYRTGSLNELLRGENR